MPRLERLRMVSIGHPQARFDDFLLDLRDGEGRPTDSTLWLRNGGGKSSILNLFFALVRPDRREFLGGRAEARQRRIEDYVLKDDRAVVAAEWTLDDDSRRLDFAAESPRFVTGAFYEWRSSGSAGDGLRRLFFAARVAPDEPRLCLDGLPLFLTEGGRRRRRTLASFRQEWQELRKRYPHEEVVSTESQREWSDFLESAGIDPELFSYQIRMNQREGGVDELFRFAEHEQFIDFLLELALDPALGDRVGRNIATYRRELRDRKDRILPERELLSGLAERLAPLAELAGHREDLGARIADTHGAMQHLARHVEARTGEHQGEAERHAAQRDTHRAAAETAGSIAREHRSTAATLRHFAARLLQERAAKSLDKSRREMEEAQRRRHLLEAAVPLRDAQRLEAKAERYREELERKKQEFAPQLEELRSVASRYAAALRHRAETLRTEAGARDAAEEQLREDARTSRDSASQCREAAAVAHAGAEQLLKSLAESEAERDRLRERGVLAEEETAAAATTRLGREIDELAQRAAALAEKEESLRRRREQLQEARGEAQAAAAAAEARAHAAADRLQRAADARRAIESESLLHRILEVESVDLSQLPDQAVRQLHDAARTALGKVVSLRIESAADDRAVLHLEETGLLPPTPDAERLLDLLRSHLPAAWSGWEYLESNVSGEDSRRRLIEQSPELALGVVVRETDFERAVEVVRQAALSLDTPVVLTTPAAFDAPGSRRDFVAGPTSRAAYDRDEAATELLRRRGRLDSIQARIEEQETLRGETEALLGRLKAFQAEYPEGWFDEQERVVQAESAEAETLKARAARLAEELSNAAAEAEESRRDAQVTAQAAARCQTWLALARQYLEAHEVSLESRRLKLAAAREEVGRQQKDAERWLAEAQAAEGMARTAALEARRLGEEAGAAEKDLREVEYTPADVEPTAGPVAELRDRYAQVKMLYEERVGEEGLLRLSRDAEEGAREQREKLAAVLAESEVEQAKVEAALAELDDPSQVDAALKRAIEDYASAKGSLGNISGVEKRTREQVEETQARCEEIGADRELAPEEQPPGPVQAEAAARVAEKEAVALDARVRESEAAAQGAEEASVRSLHAADMLTRDGSRLESLTASYRDLLGACRAPESDPDSTPVPWVAPADDRDVPAQIGAFEAALTGAREEAARLDGERRKAASAIRHWASAPRFEALKSRVARQMATAEDVDLERQAESWKGAVELRVQTIDDQLKEMDKHRDVLVSETLAAAEDGLGLIRRAAAQSKLPEHIQGMGGAQFLRILTHVPDEGGERRGRIGALIDELVDQGEIPGGLELVQGAVRRLAKPLRVKVLNPDPDVQHRAVDITEMARFSGGEQLTGAILLYCTLAQLRARTRGSFRRPSTVLLLDNPIGRASRVRFLELQREVARAMGVQLIYTTAVNDLDALRTLPNVIRVRNERIDRRTGARVVEVESEAELPRLEVARVVRREGREATANAAADEPVKAEERGRAGDPVSPGDAGSAGKPPSGEHAENAAGAGGSERASAAAAGADGDG